VPVDALPDLPAVDWAVFSASSFEDDAWAIESSPDPGDPAGFPPSSGAAVFAGVSPATDDRSPAWAAAAGVGTAARLAAVGVGRMVGVVVGIAARAVPTGAIAGVFGVLPPAARAGFGDL
jgi:hypothetical protein